MSEPNWTTSESIGNLVAEELLSAMNQLNIRTRGCWSSDDDDPAISISFHDLKDAELMMTLGIKYEDGPGTLYDRSTAACITLAYQGDGDRLFSEEELDAAVESSWNWIVHPNKTGSRMAWHATVFMSVADAQQVTANLNAFRIASDTFVPKAGA